MPTINVTGKSPPYKASDRREAEFWNSNYDSKRNHTWQSAQYENRQRDAAAKVQEKAANASAARGFKTMEAYVKLKQTANLAAIKEEEKARLASAKKSFNTAEAYAATIQRDNIARVKTEERATLDSAKKGFHAFESYCAQQMRRNNQDQKQKQAGESKLSRLEATNDRQRFTYNEQQRKKADREKQSDEKKLSQLELSNDRQRFAYNERNRKRADAEAKRTAVEAGRAAARRDPETYVQSGLSHIGSRGAHAAASGDKWSTFRANRKLNLAAKRTQAEMRGATGARREALQQRLSKINEAQAQVSGAGDLELLGGEMMSGPLGWAAATAGAAYKAAKFVWDVPSKIAGFSQGLEDKARPYRDLKYASADMGRANNFRGQDLLDKFYTRGAVPGWMKELGLTPQEAMSAAASTGLPYARADDARNTVEDLARANRDPGLAGLGMGRLGQSLNLGRTLGVQFDDPTTGTQRAQLLGPEQGNRMANPGYLKMLSDATAKGTLMGLDRSQTLGNIEGLFRQASSAGATRVNGGEIADSYLSMASSGAAGARTGESQATLASGTSSAIDGLGKGGNAGVGMVINERVGQMGGLPKTREALAKFYGISNEQLKAFESTPVGKAEVQNMLGARSQYEFGEFSKPLLQSYQTEFQGMVSNSGIAHALGSNTDISVGNLLNIPTDVATQHRVGAAEQAARYNTNDAKSDLRFFMGRGWSRKHALGILGNLEQESSGLAHGRPGDNGTSDGLAQWHDPTRRALFQKIEGVDIQHSTRQQQLDFVDWELNHNYAGAGKALRAAPEDERASAAVVRAKYEQPANADGQEDTLRGDRASRLDRETADVADNDTSREDAAKSRNGAIQTAVGEQNNEANNGIMGGETGGALVSLTGAAVSSADALTKLTGVVDDVVRYVRGALSGGGGHGDSSAAHSAGGAVTHPSYAAPRVPLASPRDIPRQGY